MGRAAERTSSGKLCLPRHSSRPRLGISASARQAVWPTFRFGPTARISAHITVPNPPFAVAYRSMLAYTAAGQFHSFAFVPHTARRGSGRRIPRWHPNSSSVRPCAPGSTKTVSGSLVRPHRLHREPPEHGMPRLDSRRGLRVLWQRQRFAGTRNCGGWQVIHGPPARLILKRAASQGIGRVHARIRLCTDGRCELLGLVWGRLRLGASSRTPREDEAHQKEVCFHSKRCLAA